MRFPASIRSLALAAAFAGSAVLLCPIAAAQNRHGGNGGFQHQGPPPSAGRPQPGPSSQLAPIQRHENPGQRPQNGEHLAGWLDQHRNLTPAQQQQALEKEPGFSDLPPQTQQRMRDRLNQLNAMSPEQRSRLLARTETMEHLTPEQRGQVRDSMQQLASLPPASRRAVSRAFRNLRDMSPEQRSAYLNSPDIRSQFTDQERSTLSRLMTVEPYLPPPPPRSPNEPNQ